MSGADDFLFVVDDVVTVPYLGVVNCSHVRIIIRIGLDCGVATHGRLVVDVYSPASADFITPFET